MSGFYVEFEELEYIQRRLGGTRKQLTLAYNAALKKTLRQLHLKSVAMMIDLTGAKDKKHIKKRTQAHQSGGGNKRVPRAGKIWFGLDGMPVSSIEGEIFNRAGPELRRQRDSKGRFIRGRGPEGAFFSPRSSQLETMSFPDAFVATFRGKESIFERIPGKSHLREVRVPIRDEALNDINTGIFRQANTILMAIFKKELDALIQRGYGA